MKSRLTYLLLAIVAAVAAVTAVTVIAAAQNEPRTLLEAARKAAVVDGDLNAAIRQYRTIVDKYKNDHAIAADALVSLAECYEKLGDAQARTVYEQILRDYPDQKDAASLARTRLGVQPLSTTDVQTRWRGPDVETQGTISPDGRYLSYADNETGDLAIRDLVAGTSRRLTAAPGDFSDFHADWSAISRDGKQVAYAWFVEKTGRYDLRILPMDATPQTAPRLSADNPELRDIYPYDWSPDGRWIAVSLRRGDSATQIGLVATRDLSIRALKSEHWRRPTKMFFSPDGRYLAYDMPVDDASRQRDVFVQSVDASREVAAVAHSSNDVIMGWAPDGRSLLFASNRTGPMSLWTLPMADGKPTGLATLLRPDIGPVTGSLGVTTDGTLALGVQTGGTNIYTATIDPTTGKVLAAPTPLVDGYLQTNIQPAWSPDGKAIAYQSFRPSTPSTLVIQSLDTGRTTEIQPLLSYFLVRTWAPDGSITLEGTDLKGRRGLYRIDSTSASGQASQIATSRGGSFPSWSSDRRVLVYQQAQGDSGGAVIVRDIASGSEREIAKAPGITRATVSPDGRQVAYVRRDAVTKANTLEVISTEGGTPRQLLRVAAPITLGNYLRLDWTADGRRLGVTKHNGSKTNMLLVLLDGAIVEIESLAGTSWTTLHPDGRRLAFSAGTSVGEVRVVDLKRPAPARR